MNPLMIIGLVVLGVGFILRVATSNDTLSYGVGAVGALLFLGGSFMKAKRR